MRPRRTTHSLTLVLIGTAALSGCGEEGSRRDIYRTQAQCLQDWGNDLSRCEQARSGPHTGYFYGPHYRGGGRQQAGATTMPRTGSQAVGTAHVPRGGFGSSASAHSSSSGG